MTQSVQPVEVQGITYYSTPKACISNFANRPWTEKAVSAILSFGTLFLYAINRALGSLRNGEEEMLPYMNAPNANSPNKRLIVCLHGLNNHPMQFKRIIAEIKQQGTDQQSDIYIPRIPERGNAKLDDMMSPVVKVIAEWAKGGEEKELVLMGISNGGRIARAVRAELINSNQMGKIKRLKFVSIVGACKGSSLVNLARIIHLSWILSKNIAEEMPIDSERCRTLEEACLKATPKSKGLEESDVFIASPHDWQVPDYVSSLMCADNQRADTHYAIVPNHGHNSIVDAVASSVASMVLSDPQTN